MKVIAAALVAAITLGFDDAAVAAPGTLREAFASMRGPPGRSNNIPPVARYMIDEGGSFTLDRRDKRPLLKFEDSPEIWALQPTPGPRGDTIYKNDAGETMLRSTKLGGMTVFTPRRSTGAAAAVAGPAQPLRLQPLNASALYQRFFQASVRSSQAARHLIGFETIQDADPSNASLYADAVTVVVEALVGLSARPEGRSILARISKVDFVQGPRPQAYLRNGVLVVTVAPGQGLAGRPSSRRIQQAVFVR